MIAHVCASTGWTWDYVADNLDLPRIGHLNDYWRGHPPRRGALSKPVRFLDKYRDYV